MSDFAHVKTPFLRQSQCHRGAPGAGVSINDTVHAHVRAWLRAAATVAPTCFTPYQRREDIFASVISHKYRFVYQINAKAASNTIVKWLVCSFGAEVTSGQPVPRDYLRLTSVRDPWTRALSGYKQVIELIKTTLNAQSSQVIEACLREEQAPNCSWGSVVGVPVGWLLTVQPNLATLVRNLVNSSFYVESFPFSASAAEYARYLRLVARTGGIGCGPDWYAGEHGWPQWMHYGALQRIDFAFRIEHMAKDQRQFQDLLRSRGHVINGSSCERSNRCRPGSCTIGTSLNSVKAKLRDRRETAMDGTPINFLNLSARRVLGSTLANAEALVTLQRFVCAIYLPDILCNGYRLPTHCTVGTGSNVFPWLESTMRLLMGTANLSFLSPPIVAVPTVSVSSHSECSCTPSELVLRKCSCKTLAQMTQTGTYHIFSPQRDLSKCPPGNYVPLPLRDLGVTALLQTWLKHAVTSGASACFSDKPPIKSGSHSFFISRKYGFVYTKVRNSGSNAVLQWMKCALGVKLETGIPPSDYLQVTSVRDPWIRLLSSYEKIERFIRTSFEGRSAAEAQSCLNGSSLPSSCKWGRLAGISVGDFSRRHRGNTLFERVRSLAALAFYDTQSPFPKDYKGMLQFFKVVALSGSLGCQLKWYGMEMILPQWQYTSKMNRIDVVLRVEHLAEDQKRLLELLGVHEKNLSCKCRTYCKLPIPRSDFGNVLPLWNSIERRQESLNRIPSQLEKLVKLSCALSLPDYACFRYPLPQACTFRNMSGGNSFRDEFQLLLQKENPAEGRPIAEAGNINVERAHEKSISSASIGIVTVDTRRSHPGQAMWAAYAAQHQYKYIPLHPGGFAALAKQGPGIPDPALMQDWMVSNKLLNLMHSSGHKEIGFVLYVELDQWVVQPAKPLGPLILQALTNRPDIMLAIPFGEGCGGNIFSDRLFMARTTHRSLRKLLMAWSTSTVYGGKWNPRWPGRQGAFWHDVKLYSEHLDSVNVMNSSCPLGSPFNPTLAHAPGRKVPGQYDPIKGRAVYSTVIEPCVMSSLANGSARACSLHPPWVGGHCQQCVHTLKFRLPDGTFHYENASQCCSKIDRAIPVAKFHELRDFFEARKPEKVIQALVDIYEGRAPIASYLLGLHSIIPEIFQNTPLPLYSNPREGAGSAKITSYKPPDAAAEAPVSNHECHASGICDAPAGCSEQMDEIAATPLTSLNQFLDYRNCLNRSSIDFHHPGSASAVNAFCAGTRCASLAQMCLAATESMALPIAIVTVDTRTQHSGAVMWRQYCISKGYTFIQLFPKVSTTVLQQPSRPNPIMLQDWNSNRQMLDMLRQHSYSHIHYFMYTELDQWMVQPAARLEPLFRESGLVRPGGNVMAVVEEYPCRNVRNGGVFNMGTFLFRRDAVIEQILTKWVQSEMHGGEWGSTWPARQGAFSHDPEVYNAFRSRIHTFRSACPLGSPFGLILGHTIGGYIVGAYDPDKARLIQTKLIEPCVLDALSTGTARTCSLHPPWVGGQCLRCTNTLVLRRSDGQRFMFNATNCCGDVDSAIPVAKYHEMASIFEARNPRKIIRLLVQVFQGIGPLSAFALGNSV